jgi:hypothetical protein
VKKEYEQPTIETDPAFVVLSACGFLADTDPACDPYVSNSTFND